MEEQEKRDEQREETPATTPGEPPAPADYSRYMGTLNRLYRRNNNPKRRRLGDGITSLKKDGSPAPDPAAQQNPDGKKDHSFLIALAVSLGVILIIWALKNFPY
ncbi:MAG: hypothetical protein H9864_08390 [Candidatus Faecalibacterium intestinavium]|uniref:Uncharacterized protein n=1 Tax=Candidatus Faecalibacterium intestinavium TaxID=2838580 RepID=A0A9E2KMS8_9FIRM|nr:hypothetical protein [Candidatus Faecalibacterium intestinavium]